MHNYINRINLIKNQLNSSHKKTPKKPKFIDCALSYLHFDDLLKPEEKNFRINLRKYLQSNKFEENFNYYIEIEEFPKDFFKDLHKEFPGILVGLSETKTFPKFSVFLWASILIELARCDGNIGSLFAGLSELGIKTLFLLGSETQKSKYLNGLIKA